MTPNRATRLLTLVFAALQFAVPAVVSVADGAVARGGRNPAGHAEEVGGTRCRPPHTEDCLICRFLSATHSAAGATAAPAIEQTIAPVRSAFVAFSAVGGRYGFSSRAPPALLG